MATVAYLQTLFDAFTKDGSKNRWPDATRYVLWTEAQRHFIRESEIKRATVTTTITADGIETNSGLITYSAATATGYGLNKTDVYQVTSAYWNGEPLHPMSQKQLEKGSWKWREDTGVPCAYNLDAYGEGYMWLYPTPLADSDTNGFRLDYIPMPTAFSANGDTISVGDAWVMAINYKALELAFQKETDQSLVANIAKYKALYEEELHKAVGWVNTHFGQTMSFGAKGFHV